VLAACGANRPSASAVSASKEAAARSTSFVPPVSYALEIDSPRTQAERRTSIPWLELRGRSGTAELFEADIVIVLDISLSTMFPSGMDLDGDGVIGEVRGVVRAGVGGNAASIPTGDSVRMDGGTISVPESVLRTNNPWALHPRNWTTDRDDTIAELEFEAARSLLRGFGPRRNRIGLVTYTERGRVRAEMGEPDAVLAALDAIRVTGQSSGRNVAAGLRQARLLFSKLEDAAPDRQRAVLLFTDGQPTYPDDPYIARLRTLYEADALAERGVDLYVFAIGQIGVDGARFLLELAGAAGGRVYRVWDPRRLLDDLPPLALAPRWLEIVNATIGAPALAVRTSRDGRFDAFVPLAPGANRIRVMAELGDGKLQRWEKDVHYQPPAVETEAHRRAAEAVQQELEARAADPGPAPTPEPVPAVDPTP
jgi:hypothetical protein